MIIKLNKDLLDYLNNNFKKELFITKKSESDGLNLFFIEVDINLAEEIRDWATIHLQKKGFDEDYELTYDGQILEELIDLFYNG
jgi:hypothetical protein